jgi:hypothetical protein
MNSKQPTDPQAVVILDYLANGLPDYPYDPDVDLDFVQELLEDFSHLDLLEQLKSLRWYSDNQPFAAVSKPRLALRRWLARANR